MSEIPQCPEALSLPLPSFASPALPCDMGARTAFEHCCAARKNWRAALYEFLSKVYQQIPQNSCLKFDCVSHSAGGFEATASIHLDETNSNLVKLAPKFRFERAFKGAIKSSKADAKDSAAEQVMSYFAKHFNVPLGAVIQKRDIEARDNQMPSETLEGAAPVIAIRVEGGNDCKYKAYLQVKTSCFESTFNSETVDSATQAEIAVLYKALRAVIVASDREPKRQKVLSAEYEISHQGLPQTPGKEKPSTEEAKFEHFNCSETRLTSNQKKSLRLSRTQLDFAHACATASLIGGKFEKALVHDFTSGCFRQPAVLLSVLPLGCDLADLRTRFSSLVAVTLRSDFLPNRQAFWQENPASCDWFLSVQYGIGQEQWVEPPVALKLTKEEAFTEGIETALSDTNPSMTSSSEEDSWNPCHSRISAEPHSSDRAAAFRAGTNFVRMSAPTLLRTIFQVAVSLSTFGSN